MDLKNVGEKEIFEQVFPFRNMTVLGASRNDGTVRRVKKPNPRRSRSESRILEVAESMGVVVSKYLRVYMQW